MGYLSMLFSNWLFITSIVCFITALVLQYRFQQTRVALVLLFGAAFLARLFFAHTDPFLHPWDEKFHALVAKSMMSNPLKPMLKTDALYISDPNVWCCNHIWLHKQPLFMWQMALSMKIFGVSAFSIRYPSVLMGALMILLLYRIARITLKDKNLSFFAASLFCFSYYHLELISGYKGMDHNDVAFGFYTLASIWAYFEYLQKRCMKWAILIGIFAGCAILNKWLTGLLVYAAWGISFLYSLKAGGWKEQLKYIAISVVVCAAVFLPWQLYILNTYPDLAMYEYRYNSKHIAEAVEGHSGSAFFYLKKFKDYYGPYLYMLIPLGIIAIFFRRQTNKPAALGLSLYFLLILGFFSLVVATKMETYFFVIAPMGYIFIAAIFSIGNRSKWHRYLLPVVTIAFAYLGLQHQKLQYDFGADNHERQARIYNANVYRQVKNMIPDDIDLVINVNEFEDVDVMFYNDGINANHYWYSEEDMERFKKAGIKIAAFKSRPNYGMPDYVTQYPNLYIIDADLK